MNSLKMRSGVSSATFSISTPPSGLTISTGRSLDASITMPRYSSRSIRSPCSTSSRWTICPDGPVWWVTSRMPIIAAAALPASSGPLTTLTPPPLPRPAGVDLRLDDHRAAAKTSCDRRGVGRVDNDFADRHGHAVTRQDGLGLIFVNLHATSHLECRDQLVVSKTLQPVERYNLRAKASSAKSCAVQPE